MKPTDPVVPLLNPLDPRVSEAVAKLREADHECEQLIKEVDEYDWSHGAYPLLAGFYPYPEKDMDRFQERAREAKNLKIRIVAILHGLGTSGDPWRTHIEKIDFYESYELTNPFLNGPKRPSPSGLGSAREILRTAIGSLGSVSSTAALAGTAESKRTRSMGSPQAVKVCQHYMNVEGLTQAEFGSLFETTDRTVRSFLTEGKMQKSLFRKMARAMGLSPEQLLRGELPPHQGGH